MNNVSEKVTIKNANKQINFLELEQSDHELAPVLYMYGNIHDGLAGTHTIIDWRNFASIQDLEDEIKEQREALCTGFDKYGNEMDADDLQPWQDGEREDQGLIVCEEGIFDWSWEREKYEFVGNIRRTVRRNTLSFIEDAVATIGAEVLQFNRGETFLINGEYVAYDEKMNPIIMLIVYNIGSLPIAIPYDSKIMNIYHRDFAIIAY